LILYAYFIGSAGGLYKQDLIEVSKFAPDRDGKEMEIAKN
jgi:hypothetical protein